MNAANLTACKEVKCILKEVFGFKPWALRKRRLDSCVFPAVFFYMSINDILSPEQLHAEFIAR
jgi:hypothetical protein